MGSIILAKPKARIVNEKTFSKIGRDARLITNNSFPTIGTMRCKPPLIQTRAFSTIGRDMRLSTVDSLPHILTSQITHPFEILIRGEIIVILKIRFNEIIEAQLRRRAIQYHVN
jgi:hypothetical protein